MLFTPTVAARARGVLACAVSVLEVLGAGEGAELAAGLGGANKAALFGPDGLLTALEPLTRTLAEANI